MDHKYCVIMCGGVGSRFWPYSRQKLPKQFLDFFGTGRSLLQMTYDRITPLVRPENILLVTNVQYADIITEQLPGIPCENILFEPARRNTAPCIYWAARHIHARDPKASIVTLPSDHLILKEQEFHLAIAEAFEFVETRDALLTLGIRPRSPHTGYGYIQANIACTDFPGVLKAKSFTEKPDPEIAKLFVDSGEFFWNSGMFVWRSQSVIDAFRRHASDITTILDSSHYGTPEEERFVHSVFPNCPGISVDYAIMERADNVYVKTVDLGWSDLGSWKSYYDISPKTKEGNVMHNCKVISNDCERNVFAIRGDKVVVVSGLEGYIVADNDNALLICPIEEEQTVRRLVNDVGSRFGEEYI